MLLLELESSLARRGVDAGDSHREEHLLEAWKLNLKAAVERCLVSLAYISPFDYRFPISRLPLRYLLPLGL